MAGQSLSNIEKAGLRGSSRRSVEVVDVERLSECGVVVVECRYEDERGETSGQVRTLAQRRETRSRARPKSWAWGGWASDPGAEVKKGKREERKTHNSQSVPRRKNVIGGRLGVAPRRGGSDWFMDQTSEAGLGLHSQSKQQSGSQNTVYTVSSSDDSGDYPRL